MSNKNTVDLFENVSAIKFARLMFENTAEDGTLQINNWYDVDCEDCLTYYNFVAKIKWDENDLEDIRLECNELFCKINRIAKHYKYLDGTYETANEYLCSHDIATYLIFVAPFDATNLQELNADVIGRVSEGPFAYNLIRHSQRLCYLVFLDAPQEVIEYEERMLIASMIIHWLGEYIKIERIDE